MSVHFLCISPHTKEEEDEEPTRDIHPAIVKYNAVVEDNDPPGICIVDFTPFETSIGLQHWKIGDEDIDFDWK